jgi:hypothetical protein
MVSDYEVRLDLSVESPVTHLGEDVIGEALGKGSQHVLTLV